LRDLPDRNLVSMLAERASRGVEMGSIRRTCLPVVVGGVIAATAMTGCSSNSSGSGPSRATFISSAKAICMRLDHQRDALAPKYFPSSPNQAPTLANYMAFSGALAPIFRTTLDQLEALTPPAKDRDRVQAILTAFETYAAQSQSAATNASDARSLIRTNEAARHPADLMLSQYGLTNC
jgi:hypothetical protein